MNRIYFLLLLLVVYKGSLSQTNKIKINTEGTQFLIKGVLCEISTLECNKELAKQIKITTKNSLDNIDGCCGQFKVRINEVDFEGYKSIYFYKINGRDSVWIDTLILPIVEIELPSPNFIGLSYQDTVIKVNMVHAVNGVSIGKPYPNNEFRHVLSWFTHSFSIKVIRDNKEFIFKSNKWNISKENYEFFKTIQVGDKIIVYDILLDFHNHELIKLKDLKFTVVADSPPVKTRYVSPK